LERLLQDWDLEYDRIQEEQEKARRRQMTDAERMQEIKEQADREDKPKQNISHQAQRYYHRGAFYMDDSEWKDGESDIRHKAAEYAAAATGSDKIDKRNMPKVMQVKNFGFANQNTKYKGLVAEDTTDKQMDMLPLVTTTTKGEGRQQQQNNKTKHRR
jgi:microfibrillar-associated protein 1